LYANGIVVELQELMVAPERRHQGIGRQLVEGIVERASAAGAVEVTVPTRRARDFYLPLGFAETAAHLKRALSRASQTSGGTSPRRPGVGQEGTSSWRPAAATSARA